MLCALIMAGGKGTRFWPLSTEEKPKQFLRLIGDRTMIQMTVDRIEPIIPIERIFVCTGEKYVNLVREQLPNLPKRNIIIEPEGRNTAPCIALSALVMKRYYKNATMVVLPSDHLIRHEESFRNILINGEEYLSVNNDAILTLGMTPDRAETGYGYIKFTNKKVNVNEHEIINVEKFVEKPDKNTAKKYLSDGSYLWNGGMFLWTIDNIIKQINKFSPSTYKALKEIDCATEENLQQVINENYEFTESISIDYAVLEKSNDIYVIPSNIGWDDVGSFEAIERYRERDEHGNIHVGKIKGIHAENNLIISSNNDVIIDGLSDLYVIENDGKIIIGKKENVCNVKELRATV